MPMTTANRSGTRIVETRKARPRICSRYSRWATRTMLRIGLASYGLNEDLFQRRLDQFKAVNGGHRYRRVQQLLGIAVRVKANLGVAGVIFGRLDLGAVEKGGIAFKFNDHAVALVA